MAVIKNIICVILILMPLSAFAQSKTIAILPFEVSGKIEDGVGDAVAEITQNAFVQHSDYKVIERKQIQKVLDEQSFQLTGATENVVELGKILGVDRIVTGSLTKLGKEFTLVMKLIDAETGEVLKSEKISAQISIEDIDNIMIDLMVEILTSTKQRSGFTLIIKKGTGLKKMDFMTDTDAWVQVFIGNRLIGRTEKVQDNNSPEFNERFEISDYSGELILLKVFDHDVTGEQPLGQVIISEPKTGMYPIIGNVNGQNFNVGQIEVAFE